MDTKTKHTPGPWKLEAHGYYNQWQIFTTHKFHPIAEVQAGYIEAEANARLIAKSPEMFSLLVRLKNIHPNHQLTSSDIYQEICELVKELGYA